MQLEQYRKTVRSSFPDLIFESEIVKHCWPKIEKYFPEFQVFLVDQSENIIGFINSIPFYWDQPLQELPDDGWDWLVNHGIEGFEKGIQPNCIGGLQIIVSKSHLGKGYSKLLIDEGKKIKERLGFQNLVIPIRPTLKSNFPNMDMEAYINYQIDGKVYDPWIRTHLSSGAEIIKICPNAMNIQGDIAMWEKLIKQKIHQSGNYEVEGGLNHVYIDLENNNGEYREDNIWIGYG